MRTNYWRLQTLFEDDIVFSTIALREDGVKFDIGLAVTDKDIVATYSVMRQLRPNVKKSDYLKMVRLQEKEIQFRLARLKVRGRVECAAGFRLCRSLGWGRYLYVDDLVTDKNCRSKGVGKMMFSWLVEYARQQGCDELRLDSAVYRHEAHRFYLRERMDINCFNFSLDLRARRQGRISSN